MVAGICRRQSWQKGGDPDKLASGVLRFSRGTKAGLSWTCRRTLHGCSSSETELCALPLWWRRPRSGSVRHPSPYPASSRYPRRNHRWLGTLRRSGQPPTRQAPSPPTNSGTTRRVRFRRACGVRCPAWTRRCQRRSASPAASSFRWRSRPDTTTSCTPPRTALASAGASPESLAPTHRPEISTALRPATTSATGPEIHRCRDGGGHGLITLLLPRPVTASGNLHLPCAPGPCPVGSAVTSQAPGRVGARVGGPRRLLQEAADVGGVQGR